MLSSFQLTYYIFCFLQFVKGYISRELLKNVLLVRKKGRLFLKTMNFTEETDKQNYNGKQYYFQFFYLINIKTCLIIFYKEDTVFPHWRICFQWVVGYNIESQNINVPIPCYSTRQKNLRSLILLYHVV